MPIKTNLKSLTPRRQAFKKLVTLPSHGFSSPTAWPDGQITIYPWDSSIDDFLLDNSRKSASRHAVLFDLVAKLCDLNGAKLDDFVADETNIVLLVSRALSQDSTIVYTSICPFCNAKEAEHIKVPDELEKVSEKAKDYPGFDTLTLPDCKDVVKVRPLLIKDERIVLERSSPERAKLSDNTLRNLLRVVSINDSTPDKLAELQEAGRGAAAQGRPLSRRTVPRTQPAPEHSHCAPVRQSSLRTGVQAQPDLRPRLFSLKPHSPTGRRDTSPCSSWRGTEKAWCSTWSMSRTTS